MSRTKLDLFDPKLIQPALFDAFRKLSPSIQLRNPVMFVCFIGSIGTTLMLLKALAGGGDEPVKFILSITLWLWFTLLFANFAEALAEGRSKAQAASSSHSAVPSFYRVSKPCLDVSVKQLMTIKSCSKPGN